MRESSGASSSTWAVSAAGERAKSAARSDKLAPARELALTYHPVPDIASSAASIPALDPARPASA